jgi:hypothetical protein
MMDATSVSIEMEQSRRSFHELVAELGPSDLRRRSVGTRWTNRQLLFHLVFGYLVVRALMPLVRGFGRLPLRSSRWFAALLHAGRRPYHLINYLGSCLGGALLTPRRMVALLDRCIAALQRSLAGEDERSLALRMAFPTSWDPYFTETMTVLEVYHFGTQHFLHHRRQLARSR